MELTEKNDSSRITDDRSEQSSRSIDSRNLS
ncbi:transposase, partial [Leptospira mayottensis]